MMTTTILTPSDGAATKLAAVEVDSQENSNGIANINGDDCIKKASTNGNNGLSTSNGSLAENLSNKSSSLTSQHSSSAHHAHRNPIIHEHDDKKGFFSTLTSIVGMDVQNMRMSVPLWVFEPTSALMRMAETYEFCHLLNEAACCDDEVLRNTYMAAFVVSAFAHTTRTGKPFVPVLGETFEYKEEYDDGKGRGIEFFAEQVSSNPDVAASFVQGQGWKSGETVDVMAFFHGNAIEVKSRGSRYVVLEKYNEVYSWNLPISLASNLLVGGAFLDHFGVVLVTNHTTGYVSELHFRRMGWFNAGKQEFMGWLVSPQGAKVVHYEGKWASHFNATFVSNTNEGKKPEVRRLWTAGDHKVPNDKFKFTKYTYQLLGIDPKTKEYAGKHREAMEADFRCPDAELERYRPAPTDSRYREDIVYHAKGQNNLANQSRSEIEKKCAARERELKSSHKIRESVFFVEVRNEVAELLADRVLTIISMPHPPYPGTQPNDNNSNSNSNGNGNEIQVKNAVSKPDEHSAESNGVVDHEEKPAAGGDAESKKMLTAAEVNPKHYPFVSERSVGDYLVSGSRRSIYEYCNDYWAHKLALTEEEWTERELF